MYLYPSILGPNKAPHDQCYAFEKLDGSNLRWEYSKKQGWCKAGSRHRLFDESEPILGQAIPLFNAKYAEPIAKLFKDTKELRDRDRITVFAEFFGPNSFAGNHVESDPKELVLFDVHLFKLGILGPKEFLELFGHLHVPRLIYQGPLSDSFISDVKQGKYDVVEGVVCKGGKAPKIWMRKIKTLTYLQKLKDTFGSGWESFGE